MYMLDDYWPYLKIILMYASGIWMNIIIPTELIDRNILINITNIYKVTNLRMFNLYVPMHGIPILRKNIL